MLSQPPIPYNLNRCIKALIGTVLERHGNSHPHSDDWQRTINIDTLGVGTTDFDRSDTMKTKPQQSDQPSPTGCPTIKPFSDGDPKAMSSGDHHRAGRMKVDINRQP
jgi:hypothetical protein